jgi:hypothetical protein
MRRQGVSTQARKARRNSGCSAGFCSPLHNTQAMSRRSVGLTLSQSNCAARSRCSKAASCAADRRGSSLLP